MMKIKNIEKSSLVDYPPHISCVVFLAGCNFRCPFCYNSALINPNDNTLSDIPQEEFLTWLSERKDKLDAVVISGGEPTIHGEELLEFSRRIKELGFLIKLDTNGSNPDLMKRMIDEKLIDYVAVDLKADKLRYNQACGVDFDMSNMDKTINILSENNIPYEFRSTIVPGIHDETTIKNMILYLKNPKKYAIQQFKPISTLDPLYENITPFNESEMEKFQEEIKKLKIATEIEFRR